MKPIQEYHNLHRGKPIAILGGGPDLMKDLWHLPKDTILISVNHHALTLSYCEYMVFLDKPDTNPGLLNGVLNYSGVKATPGNKHSDISFLDINLPKLGNSSIFALWLAEYLGGFPIILCGMDLFQSKIMHCDSTAGFPDGYQHIPLERQKKAWLRYPYLHKENVYVCSGPLVGIFKKWGKV